MPAVGYSLLSIPSHPYRWEIMSCYCGSFNCIWSPGNWSKSLRTRLVPFVFTRTCHFHI